MCFLVILPCTFHNSTSNQIYCSLDILEWLLISQSYRYFCLPESQCEALLQLVLIFYQYSVHQEPIQAVTYKNWALYRPQVVEQLYTAFHYTIVASATAILERIAFLPQLLEGIFSVLEYLECWCISGFTVYHVLWYSIMRH